jgi:hypothetical protein
LSRCRPKGTWKILVDVLRNGNVARVEARGSGTPTVKDCIEKGVKRANFGKLPARVVHTFNESF